MDFDHPYLSRPLKWNLLEADWAAGHMDVITDQGNHQLIANILDDYKTRLLPALKSLPAQAIHGDANDYNLVVDGDKLTGILDFGDLMRAPVVCDIAIALAYLMMPLPKASHQQAPMDVARDFLRGYSTVLTLSEQELGLLFGLINTRLSVSLINAGIESVKKPDDPYVTISQAPGWTLLNQLADITDAKATDIFRENARIK